MAVENRSKAQRMKKIGWHILVRGTWHLVACKCLWWHEQGLSEQTLGCGAPSALPDSQVWEAVHSQRVQNTKLPKTGRGPKTEHPMYLVKIHWTAPSLPSLVQLPSHVGGSRWTIIIFPTDFRQIAFIWWAWFRWGRYFVSILQFLICYDVHKTLGIRKLGRSTFNVFYLNCFDVPTKILVSLSITNFKSHIFMVEN